MTNKGYQLSHMAQLHLIKIKSYTCESFSEQQWRVYKRILLNGFKMLSDNPELATTCSDIYDKGYYFHIGKHTVYFTKENGFILIVAVLSQSQLPQHHIS